MEYLQIHLDVNIHILGYLLQSVAIFAVSLFIKILRNCMVFFTLLMKLQVHIACLQKVLN